MRQTTRQLNWQTDCEKDSKPVISIKRMSRLKGRKTSRIIASSIVGRSDRLNVSGWFRFKFTALSHYSRSPIARVLLIFTATTIEIQPQVENSFVSGYIKNPSCELCALNFAAKRQKTTSLLGDSRTSISKLITLMSTTLSRLFNRLSETYLINLFIYFCQNNYLRINLYNYPKSSFKMIIITLTFGLNNFNLIILNLAEIII